MPSLAFQEIQNTDSVSADLPTNIVDSFDSPDAIQDDSVKYMPATNTFELALEICSLATFLYGIGFDSEFDNQTCDSFLRISDGTKNFGPSSEQSEVSKYPWLCPDSEADTGVELHFSLVGF